MKKFIYISGIISANLMFLGAIFKVSHWPGASILLITSIFTLCFIFLPLALYTAYQKSQPKKYKASYIVSYIVFTIVFVSAIFKIQHWPGAGVLMVIGIPLPIILFLPVYLFQTRKDKKYSMVNFMGIMFGLTFISVFSAMLSINVSASILNDFEDQYRSNQNWIEHIYENLEVFESNAPIQEQANKICLKIQNLKSDMLLASGNTISTVLQNNLINKDNLNIPIRILWMSKDTPAITELKQMLSKFNKTVEDYKTISQEHKKLCHQLLNVDNLAYGYNEEKNISWESHYFFESNLITSLDALTRIERNLRFVQMELGNN